MYTRSSHLYIPSRFLLLFSCVFHIGRSLFFSSSFFFLARKSKADSSGGDDGGLLQQAEKKESVSFVMSEALNGIRIVTAFGLEPYFTERFSDVLHKTLIADERAAFFLGFCWGFSQVGPFSLTYNHNTLSLSFVLSLSFSFLHSFQMTSISFSLSLRLSSYRSVYIYIYLHLSAISLYLYLSIHYDLCRVKPIVVVVVDRSFLYRP